MTYRTPPPALEAVMSDPAMTEDGRIREIRAAMASEAWTTVGDAKTLRRIRAILDSDACNCQAIPGTENYPGPWHVRGDAPHYPCANPAPRVWFPGDTVPAGVATMCEPHTVVPAHHSPWKVAIGAYVEVHGVPSPEAWHATVDRAKAEREES